MFMYNQVSMKILESVGDFFGLDIGTSSVRVVQLARRGTNHQSGYTLKHFGYAPIDIQTAMSDSRTGREKLGEIIRTAVGQSGIKTNNVAIGLPSSKTYTTIIDVPNQSMSDLSKALKYQADQYIPIPIDEAKYDWALLGGSLRDENQLEVLISSVSVEYSEDRLELVESLGYNVIAAEPDPIALVRALDTLDQTAANFIVDLGENTSDLVVTYGGVPRLVRSIPMGLNSLTKVAATNLNVKEDQARQFILRFGLAPDKLDGRVYHALESTLDNFASELTKSTKFFQNRYTKAQIGRILAAGYAATIPMMNNYIANNTNIATTIETPWHNINMTQNQQQTLANIGNEFAVAVGLAQRRP